MIIAAVRSAQEFEEALKLGTSIIFDLSPRLIRLEEMAKKAHQKGKRYFIHIDLAEGIGKDKEGIRYAKLIGVDGIISTRSNMIKLAREEELFCVQRFFVVDSQSMNTVIETVKTSKPGMIEIMPGKIPSVIRKLASEIKTPMIAGGLIETRSDIDQALAAGAVAVSTGKKEFWT